MTLTVIVLTYNRSRVLRLCLDHLEAQTDKDFEVVVVNDGSTDDTEAVLSAYQDRGCLRLRHVKQANKGPSAARNLGIASATTELCVLIGDDILVAPDFVEMHRQFHLKRPQQEVVGLGVTRWDRVHQEVTPFMEWVEQWQFDYKRLLSGTPPDWRHFYTSNLSFKTELLRANKFSEQYTRYGYSDIELGYRLAKLGRLDLIFLPNARATHVHPTTFRDSIRRWENVGFSLHLLHTQWPELRSEIPSNRIEAMRRSLAGNPPLLKMLTAIAETIWGERRHTKLSSILFTAYHRRGYMEFAATQPQAVKKVLAAPGVKEEKIEGVASPHS
jgi:glycosyltransferase involved in cell wall biosynthesis